MTTNKSIEKYLWMMVVVFLTYMLLGSFIVSKDFIDLAYLLILYSFMIFINIINKKK